ncbi:hypothetical protein BJY52DRAFT_1333457, partial [Lactarius psammicola]
MPRCISQYLAHNASLLSSCCVCFDFRTIAHRLYIAHWVNSDTQISACSVRPGIVEELGSIVRELGSTRTPFAIKCSGHNTNPGFSSTPGIQSRWLVSGTSSSTSKRGLSKSERGSPGQLCTRTSSPKVSTLLEVAWTGSGLG